MSKQTELTNSEDILKSQFDALRNELITLTTDNKIVERINSLSFDISNLKTQLSKQTELTNSEDILKSDFNVLREELLGEKFIQEIADRVINGIKPKPIKLNTASEIELRTVPGIGPKMASEIFNRIKTKGNFQNINELTEIRGISLNTIINKKWNECFDLS